jgi:hypothetical protein
LDPVSAELRDGRNPQTGKTIQIAKKCSKIKAGAELEGAVNLVTSIIKTFHLEGFFAFKRFYFAIL